MRKLIDTTFKKSVLSFFAISATVGIFIPWEEYQPRHETSSMKAFYQNRNVLDGRVFTQNPVNLESELLANIAEENLVEQIEAERVFEEMANNFEIVEQGGDEKKAPIETHFVYDYAFENKQFEESQLLEHPIYQEAMVNEFFIIDSPLLFAFDSSEINPQYFSPLNKTAVSMQKTDVENAKVWQVVGYADLSGNYLYNSKLAKKRAQAVASYLVDKGVSEAQLSVVSLGESSPMTEERSIDNNKYERRVEIHPYKAEITALVMQHNKQLDSYINQQIMSNASTKNMVFIPQNVKENQPVESIPSKDPFEQVLVDRLTTVMEF